MPDPTFNQYPALRQVVRTVVLTARTLEQVEAAERILEEWLQMFPEDTSTQMEGEQLWKMRLALEEMERAFQNASATAGKVRVLS